MSRIDLPPGFAAALLSAALEAKKEPPPPRSAALDELRILIDQPGTPFAAGSLVKWRSGLADPSKALPLDFEGYVTLALDKPIIKVMDGGWAERYDVLIGVILPCDSDKCTDKHHLLEFPADSRRLELVAAPK